MSTAPANTATRIPGATPPFVYSFGKDIARREGIGKEMLGGKGADLAEMSSIGLPVPSGFTVSTDACRYYMAHGNTLPPELDPQMREAMTALEVATGKTFGAGASPLLVSVRSGAPISMPGMMDTVLNLGITPDVLEAIAAAHGELFALDCHRRFLSMYGSVVLGLDKKLFASPEHPLTVAGLRPTVDQHLAAICGQGAEIPADPFDQLCGAVACVIESWMGDRAITYRAHAGIPDTIGTAVNIQSMVYGNANDQSASGVLFTRNPATGERAVYGEFLRNAQGEDVVSGERTPRPIAELEEFLPTVYAEIGEVVARLEHHYREMQDIEFTVESGKLYVLQTRRGQRTADAAVQIALAMLDEQLVSVDEALLRVKPADLVKLNADTLSTEGVVADTHGIGASPGAAVGRIALSSAAVRELAEAGEPAILVRSQTNAADIEGIIHAVGVLTQHGGATSHAAVVTRGMGRPCIVGCSDLDVNEAQRAIRVGIRTLIAGDWVSIDGASGAVYAGKLGLQAAGEHPLVERILELAQARRTIGVQANADLPPDAQAAARRGADGIGLCRTEHMFFAPERLTQFVAAIMEDTPTERAPYLARLGVLQEEDFRQMFMAMAARPVTIRLLDPPLHEFLPSDASAQEKLAQTLEVPVARIHELVAAISETNPMLGHRGVRLGLTHPDIYDMQAQAIVRAACAVRAAGIDVYPRIMIPLAALEGEIVAQVAATRASIAAALEGLTLNSSEAPFFAIGTMMEVPRACLVAGDIAAHVDFLSFGTNDLTQMTFGFSRDDSGSFLEQYQRDGIVACDPFSSIDRAGVGELMKMAISRARTVNPALEIGVCGEHGGDPESIDFFHELGVDYVSGAPIRLGVAQLAAAQASIRRGV